jgi:A/G-specific adenine glycosylase
VPDDEAAFETVANWLLPADTRTWNNAIMELGGTVCEKTPACEACPWREWCHAFETGDFSAPDVPTQSPFEGSRRQMRGRVIDALRDGDAIDIDRLGHTVRVDYAPDGEYGREWLRGLLADLEADGLVTVDEADGTVVRLQR